MSGAWPRCLRCADDTPARWTITAGNTSAMTQVVEPCCDRHLEPARRDVIARRWPYREVRAAEPGDGVAAADDDQATLW